MAIAKAASGKSAQDIIIIDIRKMPSVADYFVIASGTSTTQVRAITDHIVRKMKNAGKRLWHVEGESDGLWVLMDYGDVVGHVFYDQTRRFYCLERLWADAPQKRYSEPKRKATLIHHAKNKKRVSRSSRDRKEP